MHQIRKIGLMCIFIISLPQLLTEASRERAYTTDSFNSSISRHPSNFSAEEETNRENDGEQERNRKWIYMDNLLRKIFTNMCDGSLPFINQVSVNLELSRNCKRDLAKMFEGIKQFNNWAGQMLDSFGKLPNGIVRGTVNALGDYDQCLDVDVPGYFQGQYCNLDLHFLLPKREPYVKSDAEMPEVVRLLQPEGYFEEFGKKIRFIEFINPRFSICVPSTCSREELQKIANKVAEVADLPFGLHVPNCEILNREVKFDSTELIIIIILGILLSLVISSTAVDVYLETASREKENDKSNISLPVKYLLCFSLYTNSKRLLKPAEKDSIKVFHGMRVLTTFLVIIVHTCFFQNYQTAGSLMDLYKSAGKVPFQFIANGFISVQTFFFMSGVLHSYNVMRQKEKINIKEHIFRRIWRLAPAFMLVIASVIIIPHLGSGPVWNETIRHNLAEKCRARWWKHLFFINNFNTDQDMCLLWLWYIPVDFQLYILSLLVVIPMKSNPRLALTVNILIMIGSMAISTVFHVYYKLTPMLVVAFAHPEDVSYFLEKGYFRTYVHCSSVCIGLVVGYFLAKRPSKLHIPLKIKMILWLASLSVCLAVQVGVYRWSAGYIPTTGVSALYAVSSKILWTASMAWITIACSTGNGGIVTKILTLPIFVPLERLCFMVYLIHGVIHFMHVGSTRSTIRLEPRTIVYMFCGTAIISFLCAFVLSLIFESPFMALDKLMFSRKTSEISKESITLDNRKPEGALTKNGDSVEDVKSLKKVD